MNHDISYSKEVIDLKIEALNTRFSSQDIVLSRIEGNTKKTNGRVTRMEKLMLVVGTAVIVLLAVNGSPFVVFLADLFK